MQRFQFRHLLIIKRQYVRGIDEVNNARSAPVDMDGRTILHSHNTEFVEAFCKLVATTFTYVLAVGNVRLISHRMSTV